MDKKIIMAIVIFIVVIGVVGYNQYTLYKDNKRLLKMTENSMSLADSYNESYQAIKAQYDKIESSYEKQIKIYKGISDRDDKVIEMLENKLEDQEEKYQNLLESYNQAVDNDMD